MSRLNSKSAMRSEGPKSRHRVKKLTTASSGAPAGWRPYFSKEITVTKRFEIRAELERRIDAAHQLRSETLASTTRNAVARAMQAIRRVLVRGAARESPQA
jgi:hypothetical protein